MAGMDGWARAILAAGGTNGERYYSKGKTKAGKVQEAGIGRVVVVITFKLAVALWLWLSGSLRSAGSIGARAQRGVRLTGEGAH